MDYQREAEEIISEVSFSSIRGEPLIKKIAAVIELCVEEAKKGLYPKWEVDAEKRDAKAEGRIAGLEEAAKIVEDRCYTVEKTGQREHLAYLIRALIQEERK